MEFDIPNQNKHDSGIYIISNNKTSQVYIGRTVNFKQRYNKHCSNILKNECNYKFKLLISQYNDIKFKFSLLELTNDIIDREEYYIAKYNSVDKGLNVFEKDQDNLYDAWEKLKHLNDYKEYISSKNSIKKIVIKKTYKKHKTHKIKRKYKSKMHFNDPTMQGYYTSYLKSHLNISYETYLKAIVKQNSSIS